MLNCRQYDQLELVCIYQHSAKIILTSGEVITGNVVDILYNEEREECIKMLSEKGTVFIALKFINKLEVSKDPSYFQEIIFN